VFVCGRRIQSRTFILLVEAEGKITTAKENCFDPVLGKGSNGVKAGYVATARAHKTGWAKSGISRVVRWLGARLDKPAVPSIQAVTLP